MPGPTGTVWPIEPHTGAKHEILRRYLGAWFPIVKRVNPSGLNYIDGFAGPGVYSEGEEGSPVIALKTAVEHVLPMPEIFFGFIEKDQDRADHLRRVLSTRFRDLPKNISYEVYHGEFAEVMYRIIGDLDREGRAIAPTFTFVDPFGYAGFPMTLMRRLLEARACEVLITFMASRLRRFLDDFHESTIDDLYGNNEWRPARDLSGDARVGFLLKHYIQALRASTPSRFVMSFEMVGLDGNTIYWLVFATKHPKGCEVMKEAMWRVDPSGAFKFYDAAAGVRRFVLDEDDPDWARRAQHLVWQEFRGQRVEVEDIEEFVAPTPYLWRKKRILLPLEQTGKITDVSGRSRRLTYPDGCEIAFAE
jgi:three-Cys-motif partner protein